jgi:probable F420-dependent oxidoreductase
VARPFRFAVQATTAHSAAAWRDLARRVEDLGYSTLFLADHYMGPGPATEAARVPAQELAPIAAMAFAAAATETLRVGCRVFCVDYHVPAVLAKEAATLDLLSDGRLELGLGAGWSPGEYGAMGLRFGAPRDRVAKLREVVRLFKQHCSDEVLAVDGEHATAVGYAGRPRPVQRPHPPILIGGGRQHVLTLAAHEADIVSISNVPYDALNDAGLTPQQEAERRYAWVVAGAGERLHGLDIEASPFFTVVTDTPAKAAAKIAGLVGAEAGALPDHPNVLMGPTDALVEVLLQRRERYGVNYVTVQQSSLEAFAPVVAALAGS